VQIYTIGHSTRPITAFIDMLRGNAVERLVDIRTVPRSRHNPPRNFCLPSVHKRPKYVSAFHSALRIYS
jgi:uncharacterized protein (DUF488 family)